MMIEQFTHPVMHWDMTERGPLEGLEERMEAEGRQETNEEYERAGRTAVMIPRTDAPRGSTISTWTGRTGRAGSTASW